MQYRFQFLWLAAALTLAGCATPSAQTAGKKADDEYVTVTVTGSNIAKRIRKSDIAKGNLTKDEQAQLVDKDNFVRSLQPGKVVDKGP